MHPGSFGCAVRYDTDAETLEAVWRRSGGFDCGDWSLVTWLASDWYSAWAWGGNKCRRGRWVGMGKWTTRVRFAQACDLL
jgi:hypothetical protein